MMKAARPSRIAHVAFFEAFVLSLVTPSTSFGSK
jgi:hypothetical protein